MICLKHGDKHSGVLLDTPLKVTSTAGITTKKKQTDKTLTTACALATPSDNIQALALPAWLF